MKRVKQIIRYRRRGGRSEIGTEGRSGTGDNRAYVRLLQVNLRHRSGGNNGDGRHTI